MTLRVVLVDDEPLARERLRTLAAANSGLRVVAECGDGASAIAAIDAHRPDLVLLDVQMPEMNGFEVLEALPPQRPAVVFVTAYDDFALRAFEVAATDYLLKPIEEARFEAAIARVQQRHSVRATRFLIRHREGVTFVDEQDVEWIVATGNYLRLKAGGRTHLTRETMKRAESRVSAERFIRIHRSVIVNANCIASLEPRCHGEWQVQMRDGKRFTSSRTLSGRLRTLLRPDHPAIGPIRPSAEAGPA